MPADIKSAPAVSHESLEGATFTCRSEQDRLEAIDKAFDYRGDVTLQLSNGETVDGYIFNRETEARPPRIEMFIKGSDEPRIIPYADVATIAFSGKDTANGKSWQAWVTKKKEERAAEAERIRQESIKMGHL